MNHFSQILIRPVVTEKMTSLQETENKYAFEVPVDVNKIEIKKSVEETYDVTVESVRTMVCIGKKRTRGTKSGFISGRTKTYKKAIVSLSEGDTIDFYSNI